MVDKDSVALARRQTGNFLDRYWRGELSLTISVCMAGALVLGGLFLVETATRELLGRLDLHPAGMLVVTLLPWGPLVFVLIWQFVGLWRSASRQVREQQARKGAVLWGTTVRGMAVLCLLGVGLAFVTGTAPAVAEFYRMAFRGDPRFPDGAFTLLPGGKELSFSGGIKYGVAEELARNLTAAPEVRVLHLHSPGGRLRDASKLARLVRQQGLETYVSNECLSACTLVFAAGKRRWLSDAARLGFHGVALPGMAEEERRAGNEEWAAIYRSLGADATFIDKALAVPSGDMWYPTASELLAVKFVTDMDRGENFQPSGHEAVPTLAEIEASARRNDRLIDALHGLSPDLANEIYIKLRNEMVAGTLSGDTLDRIDLALEEVTLAYVPMADDEAITEFAALVAARYSSVLTLGATACFEHMGGAPLPRQALTEELRTRTAAVYEKILRTARSRPSPDQTLVDAAFRNAVEGIPEELLLVYLDTSRDIKPDEHDAYCRGGIAVHEGIARLPPDQAAAIMRQMYGPQER